MSNPIDFIDYTFPTLGIILSVRNDRVVIHYKIARYSLQDPTEIIDMQVVATDETKADQVANEIGETLEKKHLWQEFQDAENAALGEGGLPWVSGDDIIL